MQLVVGLVAATLTILSFVAQTHKIIRTRDTKSLSTPMWILSIAGFAVWIAYGVMTRELPLLIPNIICCGLAAFILGLKLWSR